jgi:hypothetical protein
MYSMSPYCLSFKIKYAPPPSRLSHPQVSTQKSFVFKFPACHFTHDALAQFSPYGCCPSPHPLHPRARTHGQKLFFFVLLLNERSCCCSFYAATAAVTGHAEHELQVSTVLLSTTSHVLPPPLSSPPPYIHPPLFPSSG